MLNSRTSFIAILIGILLIIVGILGRVLTGTTSITAFIPLFFGLPIAILGWLSQEPKRARWALITIAILAALGVLGTFSVVQDLIQASSITAPLLSRGLMFILCLVMVIICVNWFMQSRKAGNK